MISVQALRVPRRPARLYRLYMRQYATTAYRHECVRRE